MRELYRVPPKDRTVIISLRTLEPGDWHALGNLVSCPTRSGELASAADCGLKDWLRTVVMATEAELADDGPAEPGYYQIPWQLCHGSELTQSVMTAQILALWRQQAFAGLAGCLIRILLTERDTARSLLEDARIELSRRD